MKLDPEGWETPQKIAVILAHPDDPEFFCGATLARWAAAGHQISYHLLTRGDKGGSDPAVTNIEIARLREVEQQKAAKVIGARSVAFLEYYDGYLVPDLALRRDVVRIIRQAKPDVLLTSDPTNYFPSDISINHPDHRAAGQVVTDAVFPAAGNHRYFPELLSGEGLEPHTVNEVWFSLTGQANVVIDITPTWQTKIKALHEHVSQIGDPVKFDERMLTRRTPDSTPESPRYEERFRRIKFK